MATALLLGFGDIATRLVPLIHASYCVVGVNRSQVIPPPGVTLCTADCRDIEALVSVIPADTEVVVMTFTPDEYSDEGYQQAYVATSQALTAALTQLSLNPRIIFVSSTSVYHQNLGECVYEDSETRPKRFNGLRVLEAEQWLLAYSNQAVALRFGGIYGRDNNRKLARIQKGEFSQNPGQWTNRIHADDCAGMIAHIMTMESPQSRYIGCDNEPTLMASFECWLAEALDVEPPSMALAFDVSGKRCDNQRIKASGYTLKYPSYREGYQALLTTQLTHSNE